MVICVLFLQYTEVLKGMSYVQVNIWQPFQRPEYFRYRRTLLAPNHENTGFLLWSSHLLFVWGVKIRLVFTDKSL